MIVSDPYNNNMLKRGFGVYYGTRTTAQAEPSPTTGVVGDIWISWA
jgi:hypothetical protein